MISTVFITNEYAELLEYINPEILTQIGNEKIGLYNLFISENISFNPHFLQAKIQIDDAKVEIDSLEIHVPYSQVILVCQNTPSGKGCGFLKDQILEAKAKGSENNTQ